MPEQLPPRRAIAILLSRFPVVTETFILREAAELERQGQPVLLTPLIRERPSVVHREALAWQERALYVPFLSLGVLAANFRRLGHEPRRYLAVAGKALADAWPSPNLLLRTAALWPKMVALAERLQEEGIGHVHAHFATHPATAALVAHGLTGMGFSVTVHAHDLFVRRNGLRSKARAARFFRLISRFNRDRLLAEEPGLDPDKLHVIHVGVPVPPVAAAEAARPPLIVCVAALKPYKGVEVLLEACRLLNAAGRDFRCLVVGGGPLRRRLGALRARLGIEELVELSGPCRQDEVQALLRQASVVAQPSVVAPDGQMDGIPVALMEAMALARPVVASRISGIPELVEDGASGWLVPPGDPVALAGALGRVLDNASEARRRGEAGRRRVEEAFRLDRCTEELIERLDAVNTEAPAELTRLLQACSWPGLARARVGLRRWHERVDSVVAELLVSDGQTQRELILKSHRTHQASPRPGPQSARREFETLERLRGLLADVPEAGAPRPIHLGERGTLLMERSPGRPLDMLIREARLARPGHRQEALRAAVVRCGTWLRLVQENTAAVPASLEPVLAEALWLLERCGLPAPTRRALRERAQRLAAAAWRPLPRVGQHVDFWPGNVYVSDGRVELIDLEGWSEGHPYEDAAYFTLHLELFFAWPLLRRRGARLAAIFMESYLGGAPLDESAFALCRMAKTLQVLAKATHPPAPERRSPRRRALAGLLRGALA